MTYTLYTDERLIKNVNEDRVKEKSWNLIVRLFRKAISDEVIDFDEGRILESVNLNVNKLLEFTRSKSASLNNTERKDVEFLIRKIEDDAVSLAEYDEIITQYEQDMLDIIKEIVESFTEEHYF